MPQPIPYQGSKRNIAPKILKWLPDECGRLVEVFAGSAALSIYAAYHNRARSFHLNDLNGPLIALLESIILDPERVANQYEDLWKAQLGREKQFYNQIREEFNRTHRPEHFLYLLARCVKASVRYNSDGMFNQGPDNRRRGRRPESMRREINHVSALLKGKTTVSSMAYQTLLEDLNPATDIVYMDPPYQGTSGGRDARYLSGIDVQELIEFLAELNRRGIRYALSYDGHKGGREYGIELPAALELRHVEINAGRSSQSTLLGRNHVTYESLYLSPALVDSELNTKREPDSDVLVQPMLLAS